MKSFAFLCRTFQWNDVWRTADLHIEYMRGVRKLPMPVLPDLQCRGSLGFAWLLRRDFVGPRSRLSTLQNARSGLGPRVVKFSNLTNALKQRRVDFFPSKREWSWRKRISNWDETSDSMIKQMRARFINSLCESLERKVVLHYAWNIQSGVDSVHLL